MKKGTTTMTADRERTILYEVIPIRLSLIAMFVFYYAFVVFSGAWNPIEIYIEYNI